MGISILSDEEKYKFNYAFGIWGGVGANLTREGTAVSQNVLPPTGGGGPNAGTTRTYNYDTRFLTGEMMYTVRLLYKIAGNPGYGQGDILNSRTPQSAIAFGYAYDPAQNYLSSIRSDIVDRSFRQRVAKAYNGQTTRRRHLRLSTPTNWISSRNTKAGRFKPKDFSATNLYGIADAKPDRSI